MGYAKQVAEEITSNHPFEKLEEWLRVANSTQITNVLLWIKHNKPTEVDTVIILMGQTIKRIKHS